MCSHWLIQLRHPLISLFFSAVNRSEDRWSGSTEAGRVRGAPWSRELVVNFRKERRWSLLRGLTAPRQKPLIQTAARGLLWWRPLQTQLFNRFERTRKSSASIPALAALGAGKPEGAGSVTEPDSSSASEATSDMLSSACSSSLPPNETRSPPLAEGRWSGWIKRTGDISLCGESEARGIWAGVNSLSTGRWEPLPRCFFLTGPWEEEKREGARGGIALWKKAMRVRREATLMLSQWEQSEPASAASAWYFPRQETHSLWPSTASRLLWISVDEVVVAEGEKIWGSYGETTAYLARCPAHFGGNIGGYRRHRFVQLCCRPIGSFFYTCTNQ